MIEVKNKKAYFDYVRRVVGDESGGGIAASAHPSNLSVV